MTHPDNTAFLDSVLWSWVSFGFGSNVSMCPGPPSIKSMMTFLALAGVMGFFGAMGLAAISSARRDEKATEPIEDPRP